jgi:hypothetical protein
MEARCAEGWEIVRSGDQWGEGDTGVGDMVLGSAKDLGESARLPRLPKSEALGFAIGA